MHAGCDSRGVSLEKAERHAEQKQFDGNVLMTSHLAPDMKPFVYQVQSACDYLKAGAAWLSRQTPPKHEDNEQTVEDLRAGLQEAVKFAQGVSAEQYRDANARKEGLSWMPGKDVQR
jgi:uncharacterized protein